MASVAFCLQRHGIQEVGWENARLDRPVYHKDSLTHRLEMLAPKNACSVTGQVDTECLLRIFIW